MGDGAYGGDCTCDWIWQFLSNEIVKKDKEVDGGAEIRNIWKFNELIFAG